MTAGVDATTLPLSRLCSVIHYVWRGALATTPDEKERERLLREFDLMMAYPADEASAGVTQEDRAAAWGTSADAIAGQQALMGMAGTPAGGA